jgi:hypothetical protein
LLIHVEVQATSEETFAERMFSYSLRIFDKFAKPAISLTILCDDDSTWRPNQYRFIDWVMILPKPLEAEFWQEFKQFEEQCVARVPRVVATAEQERSMSYITTGERIGYERGKQEGIQEGRQEGKLEQAQALVLRQLQKRVGDLPEQVQERIQSLSLEQLEALGEALLDFRAISQGETAEPNADLFNWLQANQSV